MWHKKLKRLSYFKVTKTSIQQKKKKKRKNCVQKELRLLFNYTVTVKCREIATVDVSENPDYNIHLNIMVEMNLSTKK